MTTKMVFDAGGSGATGVYFDGRNTRQIQLNVEGEGFHVLGQSATRWQIVRLSHGTATGGASDVACGTA